MFSPLLLNHLAVTWPIDPIHWNTFVWSGRLLGALFIPSVLLQRSTRPLAALSWILALLFLPVVGILLWWGLGRNFMRRTSRRRAEARRKQKRRVHQTKDEEQILDRDQFEIFPPTHHNAAHIYQNTSTVFDAFHEAITRAEHHIHFQFFIIRNDKTGAAFRDLLVEKARQGVEVRVLYDAMGSVRLRRSFFERLRDAGGQAELFMPFHIWERRLRVNFRNHRKLIIIDGSLGLTGGVNIADEYREWLDMAYAFQGPVVYQMQETFAEDWYFATKENLVDPSYFPEILSSKELSNSLVSSSQYGNLLSDVGARVVVSGPDDRLAKIHKMFFLAITSARERLDIITPYFVPDTAILTALQTAAMGGVDVRIILPGRTDVPLTQHAGRTFWESMMESGVRLFEYQGSILHSKLLLRDTDQTLVGSANLDVRSFRHNFEANVVVESPSFNRAMSAIYEEVLQKSNEIDLDEFRHRPRSSRLIEGVARLFSPLL